MPAAFPFALSASRAVLRLLILLNLLLGAAILAMLIASLLAEALLFEALGVQRGQGRTVLIHGMRLIMVVGLLSVPLAHVVLTRLKAIVETVGRGDPFVAINASRLQTIAWALLGLELLHLAAGAIAAAVSSKAQPLDIGWSFSVTGWLAVLLLFVLARVFDHGARMREDLEGTV
jgi:hypothetical protein